MAEVCDGYGLPLAAAALRFSVRDPRIASTIVGFSHPQRVAQTLRLATTDVPDGLWQELNAV